jgi:hypothetical protein
MRGLTAHTALSAQGNTWAPPELDEAALHGPAGAWAVACQPHTEASVAGVLVSTLVAFGNAVGRSPFFQVGATAHHTNENVLLIGRTSTARKGDAMTIGMRPVRRADEGWRNRTQGGFGSGEAIVYELRDAVVPDEDGGFADPGAADKRLLIHEAEFAQVLAVASRDGQTLSPLLRRAWDVGTLENRTKKSRLIATNAHLSLLAGMTPDELLRTTSEVDVAGGLLNRFLLVGITRSKLLPRPPDIPQTLDATHTNTIARALGAARRTGAMRRDEDADELWDDAYIGELSVERMGLAGAACSRAEAHTLRLSMIYALLDGSGTIRLPHIEAALAVWRYAETTAYDLFGSRLGDPQADMIEEKLRSAGAYGLTRDAIRDLFSRHVKADRLDDALRQLLDLGRITELTEQTGGRPATRYHHIEWRPE